MENCGLYLAKVVGVNAGMGLDSLQSDQAKAVDSRLQVRILPQMENVSADNLPLYPSFFKNTLITGAIGDLVWVLANEDFTLGYVLGLANSNTMLGNFEDYSVPRDLLKEILDSKLKLKAKTQSFQNLIISYWDSNCIQFVERNTGAFLIFYKSGTYVDVRSSGILLHVGSVKNPKNGGSTVEINADSIGLSCEAPNGKITLAAKNVYLGNNPTANVMVSAGTSGRNAVASSGVMA